MLATVSPTTPAVVAPVAVTRMSTGIPTRSFAVLSTVIAVALDADAQTASAPVPSPNA